MTTKNPADLRKTLRDRIFASAKVKTKTITFFGVDVELRQPSTGRVLELRSLNAEDPKRAAMEMIINYTYVPGTDELMFEEADIEALLSMPFGEDMARMNRAISELTDIDVGLAEKNLEEALTH